MFSVQVPLTAILLGPAAGREASAALTVVNAPGVAPEQSTTALSAKAKLERRSNKQQNNSLYPEQLVIVILTPLKLVCNGIAGCQQQYPYALPVGSENYSKNASKRPEENCKNSSFLAPFFVKVCAIDCRKARKKLVGS
jgi:hypothetical protein